MGTFHFKLEKHSHNLEKNSKNSKVKEKNVPFLCILLLCQVKDLRVVLVHTNSFWLQNKKRKVSDDLLSV